MTKLIYKEIYIYIYGKHISLFSGFFKNILIKTVCNVFEDQKMALEAPHWYMKDKMYLSVGKQKKVNIKLMHYFDISLYIYVCF